MNYKYNLGMRYHFKIRYVKSGGEGIAFADDGNVVIIEGVDSGDAIVKAEVTELGERIILAKKVRGVKAASRAEKAKGGVESPYELDDEEEFGEEEDGDDEEESEEERE